MRTGRWRYLFISIDSFTSVTQLQKCLFLLLRLSVGFQYDRYFYKKVKFAWSSMKLIELDVIYLRVKHPFHSTTYHFSEKHVKIQLLKI